MSVVIKSNTLGSSVNPLSNSLANQSVDNVHVLLVGADKGHFKTVDDLLHEHDSHVLLDWASSQEEAVNALSETHYDIVLVGDERSSNVSVGWVEDLMPDYAEAPLVLSAEIDDAALDLELDRIHADRDLVVSKAKLLALYRSTHSGIVEIGPHLQILDLNNYAAKMLGCKRKGLVDKPLFDFFHLFDEKTSAALKATINIKILEGEPFSYNKDIVFMRADVIPYYVACYFTPILDRHGEVVETLLVIEDETELRRWSNKLSFQASHDSLTGLLNRSEFEKHLQQVLVNSDLSESSHVLCYIDLDQFKVVNDTCGHLAGDQLLKQLSQVLKNTVRQQDVLARLGGDEFGLILSHCGLVTGEMIAKNILNAINMFDFSWDERNYYVSASIGVAVLGASSKSWADAMSTVDSACYEAKESGRNRIHVVRQHDEAIEQRHGEMQWVSRLLEAIEYDRLVLCRQAIVPLENLGDMYSHYEMLVRMKGEDGTCYPPGAFLPAAERYNVIGFVDRWVIRATLEWLDSSPKDLQELEVCSINLSGASFNDESMIEFIKMAIEGSSVPAAKICFEVTETAAINNLVNAKVFISHLKDIGFKFALDDFGSGMSSFSYLKALPVDYLKIDGSFVRNMAEDKIDHAMVKAINEIGHVTGKKTIAEFCEDQGVLDALSEIGVDYVQGYHLGRPKFLD